MVFKSLRQNKFLNSSKFDIVNLQVQFVDAVTVLLCFFFNFTKHVRKPIGRFDMEMSSYYHTLGIPIKKDNTGGGGGGGGEKGYVHVLICYRQSISLRCG